MKLLLLCRASLSAMVCLIASAAAMAATVQDRYYAYPAVHDKHGVIAPWYRGQNGPCDFRVRIAAETLKRYPWVGPPQAICAAPHYVFNGHWKIDEDGTITPVPIKDWNNGDLGQRAAYVLSGLVDYYRYSGDSAAIAHLTWQADALLNHCLTPADHPWPRFLISVPTMGKPYGDCDPSGMIQLDIVAEVGLGLLRAYQVTGKAEWFDACKHWGDLLAAKRNRRSGQAPWGRYANPESSRWKDDKQTGGVVFLLYFFDELIRLGHRGTNDDVVQARDAGRAWLRDELLPHWTVNDVWGRNYWDWADPVQAENVTEFAARYLMDNKESFPNWRNDARNILSLFLNHTSVCPKSAGEVFSGAWAFPESCGCCGRSLWYGPMEIAVPFAQFGVEAQDPWATELARRMQILATYDGHETGVSEDNIDGGFVVNNGWFKIAHPMALKHLLATIAWMPENFAPSRETHIVHSTAVVDLVTYTPGGIDFSTFDALPGTTTVLRTAFEPDVVQAAPDIDLPSRVDLKENGYLVKRLPDGDCLVTVRHDGIRQIRIAGGKKDPTTVATPGQGAFTLQGKWAAEHTTAESGASMAVHFTGNQIRLTGDVGPEGGLAEVFLDGVKQLVGIDYWTPRPRKGQVVYYRNGLPNEEHSVKIVALGKGNPLSQGAKITAGPAFWSAATGTPNFGEGGGPTETQRMVFGYPGCEDLKDSAGNLWRPGTEFVIRLGSMKDSVAESWWTTPVSQPILGTKDPHLYRYGVHGREFRVNVTVGPGEYGVRLKFAATRGLDTCDNCVTIAINGREVVRKMDVAATAGGPNRAVDLAFPGISPRNGVIEIHFTGGDAEHGVFGEAFVQAIEVGREIDGQTVTPVSVLGRNLLRDAGFEGGIPEAGGSPRAEIGAWQFVAQGAGKMRIGRDSTAKIGGAGEAGTGSEAARISAEGRSRLVQEAAVCPESTYRGSVWVLARDEDGHGFGRTAGDSAGVILEELDAAGNLLTAHPKAAVTEAGPYRYLSREITTTAMTARVRFVLDTTLGCEAAAGSVTYDQCQLDGPPAPATVRGQVTDEKSRPLAAAQVFAGERSVRTDADGRYCLTGFSDRSAVALRAEKPMFYPQTKNSLLAAGENRVDFILPAPPGNNLLSNGNFERGFSAARSVEHGIGGDRSPWKFGFSPGAACYIYPESIYTWRKPRIWEGKEAISHVTDRGGELQLSQDVAVDPNIPLVASAWVQGLDVAGDGIGFGAGREDFAGLWIQELDEQGRVVASHPRAGIQKATPDFQRIICTFTTNPKTATVRFTLLSKIGCVWKHGAAIYDGCALEPVQAEK
ncbi:MAG: hypothetical protein GXY83_41475 [Rhodopirellula sp.]|nr:hypothetical protein [Rhodopirellula sp.]